MSIAKANLIAALCPPLPNDVVTKMLDDYQDIKQQYFLRRFRPSELNGARFAECVLRIVQHSDTGTYTPLGTSLNTESIVSHAFQNAALHESMRFFVPRFAKSLLDIRNRRDVAHVGGDVSPNVSDALLICQCADWTLAEIIRLFYNCSIGDAQKFVESINEIRIPVIAEIDGFLRVQNTSLDARKQALLVLYRKEPLKVRDTDLAKWTRYGNVSRFKTTILSKLDDDALIHYEGSYCTILPKGIAYVQASIPVELLV